MVIGKEGGKAKSGPRSVSKGRSSWLALAGIVLVGALLAGWIALGGKSRSEPVPGDSERGAPREDLATQGGETVLAPGVNRSARDATSSPASARPSTGGPSLGHPGAGPAATTARARSDRFRGEGWIRGTLQAVGDVPFPASWRLVARPSLTLAGRDHARERTLLLEGTAEFELQGLPLGGYDLVPEADGWNGEALPVLLEAGSPGAIVNLRMVRAGFVAGRVLDAEGAPAADVPLVLVTVARREERRTATDALGRFRFERVLDGAYELVVGPPLHPILEERSTLRVRAPGMTLPDLTLPPLGTLTVRVVDAQDGRPVPGATVVGSGTDGGTLEGSTDAYGELTVPHLPPGTWRLRVSGDDHRDRRTQLALDAGEPTTLVVELER